MSGAQFQGVSKNQEVRRGRLLRDTRTSFEMVLDLLSSFEAVLGIGILMCVMVVTMPFTFDIMPLLALCYVPIAMRGRVDIPFRKRQGLHELDKDDIHPGTGKPRMSRGIVFFGNRKEDNVEIWGANEDARTHIFVLGSTGAGKTEGLTSLAVNPLTWGSGFAYVDGKGDVKLWGKVFRMLRQFGREDDLLVINYMTGNADTTKKRRDKLSNTYNPLMTGNAASNIQLLVSLMDSGDGKGDMWKGRAISYISSFLPSLHDLRDQGYLMLHIGVIREYMPFPKYYELMKNPHISDKNRQIMQAFLYDVPGYKPDKGDQQTGTFLEQYGYQQMQFTRILSSLADTYGHIYQTPMGEVDFNDVVMNRRILLVLLPALETSRPELANLGKIVVAAMKRMMGSQLGSKLEGGQRELLDSRATEAPTPFLAIFDEFGYFMPEDAALMWAQARSLGFALVAAGQDLQAFFRTSKEETLAIVANSNVKIFGKIEDPNETYKLVLDRAGEAYVTEMGAYEMQDGLMGGYRGGTDARHVRVNRVEMQDLVDQVEGEVHIIVQSKVIRARMFYAVPDEHSGYEYRVNRFVKVLPPSAVDVQTAQVDVHQLLASLVDFPFKSMEAEQWDGAIYALQNAATSVPVERYRQRKQGTELGISLFMAAVEGLNTVKPLVQDESGGGSSAGAALRDTPPVDDGVKDDLPVQTANVDPITAEVVLSGSDDHVFDGAQVELSVFGPSDGLAVVDADAALFAEAAGALVMSAAGVDATAVPELSFLNEAMTVTRLQELVVAIGGDPLESAAIAQSMVSDAISATKYPPCPKPANGEVQVRSMEDALDELTKNFENMVGNK